MNQKQFIKKRLTGYSSDYQSARTLLEKLKLSLDKDKIFSNQNSSDEFFYTGNLPGIDSLEDEISDIKIVGSSLCIHRLKLGDHGIPVRAIQNDSELQRFLNDIK